MNRRFTRAHNTFNPLRSPGLLFMADGDGDGGGDPKDGKVTYVAPASQADFDRIISERLTRERTKIEARYEGFEGFKTKAAEHDAAAEAAKGEHEKALDAARKEGTAAGVASVTEAANARLVGAEARALAASAKFRNPALAVRNLDLAGIKVDAKGDVDAAAITALLAKLATDEPYLVDDGKGGKPKVDPTQGTGDDKTSKGAGGLAEARRRFGTPARTP